MNSELSFQHQYSFNINNQNSLNKLIDDLIIDYSKLLVIRIDFGIKREFSEELSYQYMNDAFKRLRNNLRHNQLFENYITYAAKLEYGLDKSWHYHVLFFFDGQKNNRDIWLSQEIGKYWSETITNDQGVYHSSNMSQSSYPLKAIGMVTHDNHEKINNLKTIASYLTKVDALTNSQAYFNDNNKAVRTFRTGIYKPKNNTAGRNRILKA